MSVSLSRCVCRVATRCVEHNHAVNTSAWFVPVMTLKTSAPLRAEPKKKKKVDPRMEQLLRERLRKKLKRLEKVPPEYIPIEDFITPAKCQDETRQRPLPRLSFEESEGRALLLKEWCIYTQKQHMAETKAVEVALEAQREALDELKLVSEELYQAALKPDPLLFPFSHEGPANTPPKTIYEAPDGKYNDITKVYVQ
ncbi:large ribosomal subunit protein mL40 isoform X2 [Echeneis naucrates]|uniref:large ribosomal subunit protein mL40 isoform X2 n=1 Tax=Echeneis naucrates TaxID=173247 RepID=UPI001113A5CD|nr:39S ribosomal protein L40, mitochondrial isoform X2 [Echeneis naucrates]